MVLVTWKDGKQAERLKNLFFLVSGALRAFPSPARVHGHSPLFHNSIKEHLLHADGCLLYKRFSIQVPVHFHGAASKRATVAMESLI